jgi:hypothetical protein
MKPAPTSFNTPKRRGGVHPLPNREKPVLRRNVILTISID